MKLLMILLCKGTCAPVSSPFKGQGGGTIVMHSRSGVPDTNNGFFKLVEALFQNKQALFQIHSCFFPHSIKLRGLPLSPITQDICVQQSQVKKTPTVVTRNEPLKICGHVIVTL